MQTLSRGWRWLVMLAGLMLPLALLAQTTPDAQLLLQGNQLLAKKDYPTAVTYYRQVVDKFPASAVRDQALGRLWQCYTELKQPDDASQALTLLRQGYPRSIVLADLDLQLLTAALTAGQPTQAEPLWKEITTQWPRSTYVWKAADAYARFVMKTDSAKAMTFLDGVLTANLLSVNERTDAQLLRFELLAAANPKQYLTEAVPAIEAGATAKTTAEIAFPARLAQQVYLPLMKAGQLDKAKSLSSGLQERLAMLGKGSRSSPTSATRKITSSSIIRPSWRNTRCIRR